MTPVNYICIPIIGQGSNDIYQRLGFCPDSIKLTEYGTGLEAKWHRVIGNDQCIDSAAAGDKLVKTTMGINLVAFTADPIDMSADLVPLSGAMPVVDGAAANGVHLTSDLSVLTDHKVVILEAWGSSGVNVIRATHDGTTSSNTYFEDSNVDFRDNGVCGGQKYVIYNLTNNNYAYVKDVQKPSGKSRYCRLTTATTTTGTATTAADFDTSDVVLVMPLKWAQYPLSDYGLMT